MSNEKSNPSTLLWAAIGAAMSIYFFHGYGHAKQVNAYQNIVLGKSWQEMKAAHVCSFSPPIGMSDMNSNVNKVKYTSCPDFNAFGKQRTVMFEFIGNKLTKAVIFMDWGEWRRVFPALEKQFGSADKKLTSEEVEAQSEDAEGTYLQVNFGRTKNIFYHFGNNFTSQFETLVLQTTSRESDFKSAALE